MSDDLIRQKLKGHLSVPNDDLAFEMLTVAQDLVRDGVPLVYQDWQLREDLDNVYLRAIYEHMVNLRIDVGLLEDGLVVVASPGLDDWWKHEKDKLDQQTQSRLESTTRVKEVDLTEQKYLTPPMIAKLMGVSEDKVRYWIKSGELEAIDISKSKNQRPRFVVHRDAFEDFQRRRSPSPAPKQTKRKRKQDADGKDWFPD